MDFNIFSILEKDSKELIHSAFMKFLLIEDNEFTKKFLKVDINTTADNVQLERSHKISKKSKLKCRFDIEIVNDNSVVVIENKFKSFPNEKQLLDYDKTLNYIYPKHNKSKFLVCFDKNLFKTNKDWIIKDYNDFLNYLEVYILKVKDIDKKAFINHYITFLKEYIVKYKTVVKNLDPIFYNQTKNENKFWIRLIYSNLKIKLDNYFSENNIAVETYISTGNTSIPLINIQPLKWKTSNNILLIQVQNGDLKFYAHTPDKVFLAELIEFAKNIMDEGHLSFKKIGLKKEKTSYIFKVNIHDNISNELTLEMLFNEIISYYNIIDSQIIHQYNSLVLKN